MKIDKSSRMQLLQVLLSLPATLVWLPICAHYLLVFGVVAGGLAVLGSPPTAGALPLAISVGGGLLSIGGLVGITSLWIMICCRDKVDAAGRWPQVLLLAGLWVGCLTSILALALAGAILIRSGFNLFIHSLFLTVVGPLVVFFQELPSLHVHSPPVAEC